MGTSRNDRSPQTPPWKLALAILGKSGVSPDRQSREVWRAAYADRGEKLLRDLSHSALANACHLVEQRTTIQDGLGNYEKSIHYESEGGLVLEMGKRALTRCLATRASSTEFVGELFSEAVSYYISRDLPSYVSAPGRVESTLEAIKLKSACREVTRNTVKEVGRPKYKDQQWPKYIAKVLYALQGHATHK